MIGCIRATAPYGPAVGNRTRRGIRGAADRRAGEPPSPGTAKREYGDRELIAASPLPRRPVRGGAMWRPGGIRRVKASHLTALPVASSVTTPARAASCPADGCAITVDAHDFASGDTLTNFSFIVN